LSTKKHKSVGIQSLNQLGIIFYEWQASKCMLTCDGLAQTCRPRNYEVIFQVNISFILNEDKSLNILTVTERYFAMYAHIYKKICLITKKYVRAEC
jgi:hypothetical protein